MQVPREMPGEKRRASAWARVGENKANQAVEIKVAKEVKLSRRLRTCLPGATDEQTGQSGVAAGTAAAKTPSAIASPSYCRARQAAERGKPVQGRWGGPDR